MDIVEEAWDPLFVPPEPDVVADVKGAIDWQLARIKAPFPNLFLPLEVAKVVKGVCIRVAPDIFDGRYDNKDIAAIFGVMAATLELKYELQTAHPERRDEFMHWIGNLKGRSFPGKAYPDYVTAYEAHVRGGFTEEGRNELWGVLAKHHGTKRCKWPLTNVTITVCRPSSSAPSSSSSLSL